MIHTFAQGSDEWKQYKLGKVSASKIADLMAQTRSGWGASRANYMADLIVERLTNQVQDGYMNAEMQWGIDKEPEALAAYEFLNDCKVQQVGFVDHPFIKLAGASPDGLVGDGMVEFKCPKTATHIEYLLSKTVPDKYMKQMHWQMACYPEAQWCDFMSYDPRLPEDLRRFIKRVPRDAKVISELEISVTIFQKELDEKIEQLLKL